MDTISRENNSMLPMGGVILGAIALAVSLFAAFSLHQIKTEVNAHDAKLAQIPDDIATQVTAASASAEKANSDLAKVAQETQDGFNKLAGMVGTVEADVANLKESQKRPAMGHGPHGAVVAGPGEYVVKPGDNGMRIARSNGCSFADLKAVNPSVNWNRLHPGQKIKLPEAKGAEPAAAAPAPEAPADAAPAPAPAPAAQ